MRRRLGKVVLVSMVLALLIGAQPASAQLSITDLGTLPGGDSSVAFGINNRGQVVGSSTAASGEFRDHAFVWENGKMTDLGTLPGAGDSVAFDINDRGQVVGWSTLASDPGHAVLWSR
jgi:probable HAF family extracellular repeat protein